MNTNNGHRALGFDGIINIDEQASADDAQNRAAIGTFNAGHIGFEGPETGSPADARRLLASQGHKDYGTGEGHIMMPIISRDNSSIASSDKPELEDKQETLCFRDGQRIIDFVLTYKHDKNLEIESDKHTEKRKIFERNLQESGLELEYEDRKASQCGKTHFVKIHAPWDVLAHGAEMKRLKMPIRPYDLSDRDTSFLSKIPNPFEVGEDILGPDEKEYFTADFNRARMDMFIIEDKNTFFSSSQRNLIVYELLLRAPYDDQKGKFGIERLLRNGCYSAAFPLHDGHYRSEHSILTQGAKNQRHLLYEAWANTSRFMYVQPLEKIRTYFGEKVGIYFAWLGFYTFMLIPPSIVGLAVFIYGVVTLFSNNPVKDVCYNEPSNFIMCPLCDAPCTYWHLKQSCTFAKFTYLFDNYGTVFFAIFMALWAATFLEFWKRKQAEIQYDWDVAGYEMEEHLRPEFEAKCDKKKLNPITQMMEPFMPIWSKISRKMTSVVVILFMIILVLSAVFGVIMYRIIIISVLYRSNNAVIKQNAKITTTATAALINLIVIMILNKLYRRVAILLTDLERPKTDTDYEDSFTLKMFLFQFINFYSAIFYIAFVKGRGIGYPKDYYYFLNKYRGEECDPAGCLIELCIQLGIIMVGKQMFNNFTEIMLPKIMNWCRVRRSLKKETDENLYTRWEQDNDLQTCPKMALFDEYLEMVIQYGFITIFVAAFPLAPLFALINNVIEIRLDAYKFVTQYKRPVSFRAQDIGIWFDILKGISFIAVLSNAFIIGWTSDFIPKAVYRYETGNDDFIGYVNSSLSVFNVSDFQPRSQPGPPPDNFPAVNSCYYSDHRYGPEHENRYRYTTMHWQILVARLSFIISFEHLIFLLTWFINYVIPDIPREVKQLMLREMFLAKSARYDTLGKEDRENAHENMRQKTD